MAASSTTLKLSTCPRGVSEGRRAAAHGVRLLRPEGKLRAVAGHAALLALAHDLDAVAQHDGGVEHERQAGHRQLGERQRAEQPAHAHRRRVHGHVQRHEGKVNHRIRRH